MAIESIKISDKFSGIGSVGQEAYGSAVTKKLGLPADIGLDSLMIWLSDRMRDSDSAIRAKMADMNDRKVIQDAVNDLVIALRDSRSGAEVGDGGIPLKAPLDNPDKIRSSEWFKALDPTVRDQIEAVLSKISVAGSIPVPVKMPIPMELPAVVVPTRLHKNDFDNAIQNLGDIAKNLGSHDEIEMVKLQSAISARGQLLQLVSNMISSFNETAKGIVGNVRG